MKLAIIKWIKASTKSSPPCYLTSARPQTMKMSKPFFNLSASIQLTFFLPTPPLLLLYPACPPPHHPYCPPCFPYTPFFFLPLLPLFFLHPPLISLFSTLPLSLSFLSLSYSYFPLFLIHSFFPCPIPLFSSFFPLLLPLFSFPSLTYSSLYRVTLFFLPEPKRVFC